MTDIIDTETLPVVQDVPTTVPADEVEVVDFVQGKPDEEPVDAASIPAV